MKKAIILTAIATAAFAMPAVAHADGPSASADANCDTFTVNASGLQAGDRLVVEQGSAPPAQVGVDEVTGTAHIALKAPADPWFDADVLLIRDHQYINLFHQMVDCDQVAPAADPIAGVVAVAEPVVPATLAVRVRRVSEPLLRFGPR